MFFRFKTALIFLFLFFSLFINNGSLEAAWWDAGSSLPIPPGANVEKQETRSMAEQKMFFTYYTSSQGADEIKDFYRKKLTLQGWKERNLAQDIERVQLPGVDKGPMKKALEANLFFENDADTLILNFIPAQFSRDGKTKFSICQTKKFSSLQISQDTVPVPELLARPKKDVAPVYPGASLVNLAEDSRSLKATYFSKADIEPVISFYKTKMPDYGWGLVKEAPLKKMDAGNCPSCQNNPFTAAQSTEAWIAEMDFANEKGDSCKIGLSEVITKNIATSKIINITTISVSYDKKTK
jgi:hypothetical protein